MPAIDLADLAGVATPFSWTAGGSGPQPGASYGIDLADIASPANPFSWATGTTPPIPAFPPTFPHAVRDCLVGDGLLAGALKGGLWWREAPSRRPGVGYPYGVYSLLNEKQTPATNHGDIWHTGLLRFAVAAKSQDTARRIVDRMVRVVSRADLEFDAGWLMELRPENPTTTGRPERAPGGALLWVEIRALWFMYSSRVLYPGQVDDEG